MGDKLKRSNQEKMRVFMISLNIIPISKFEKLHKMIYKLNNAAHYNHKDSEKVWTEQRG